MYYALLKWYTIKVTPIPHQEILEDAKDRIEDATGLRPTNEKLLKGLRALRVPPRLKDHMGCVLPGRIKCGPLWNNNTGYAERAFCSFCKRKKGMGVVESENHMWLNNGQSLAWERPEEFGTNQLPNISLRLIKGATAISFDDDYNRDSERIRILITMIIWAIWKSRNKNSNNDQEVAAIETNETLKDLIPDLVKKAGTRRISWKTVGGRQDRANSDSSAG